MPFNPTITENADLAEVRNHLQAAGDYLVELRRQPETDRGDTYAEDVRSAIDFIGMFDNVERAQTAGQRAAADQAAAAEAERLQRMGLRGPQAAGANLDEQPTSLGDAFVRSAGYEEFSQRGGTGSYSHQIEGEVRALLISSGDAGIWRPVGSPVLNANTVRQRRMFVRDLMSTGTTGLSSFPYIRELNAASLETGAAMTAEGSAKAEVSMTFVQADAPARKITAWLPATTELLADAPTLRSYIDNRLTYMIFLREEAQALKGDGNAPNLEGVMVATGHQTQTAVAGDVPATIAAAYGKIENVDGDPDGVAFNPLDFWGAMATRHSTQFDGSGDGGAPASVNANLLSWGERVVRTRALDEGEAVAASWALGATILDRTGIDITTGDQHDDYFVKNKIAVRAEKRTALPIWRPDFFVVVTIDLTA